MATRNRRVSNLARFNAQITRYYAELLGLLEKASPTAATIVRHEMTLSKEACQTALRGVQVKRLEAYRVTSMGDERGIIGFTAEDRERLCFLANAVINAK